MEDYIIATSSTSDLSIDYLKEHKIPFISYTYVLDGNACVDDCEEEHRLSAFQQMREGKLLSTSQINTFTYHEFFESLAKQGKNVIFIDMSKALSHSYICSLEAEKQIQEDYPNIKFHVIDTCCVSGGQGLLVKKAIALKEAGASYDEVYKWVEENKLNIIHRFTVDDLKWLRLGGRLSNASAIVGTLLNIKPVLYVPDDGKLVAYGKVRGRKQALLNLIEGMKRDIGDPTGKEVDVLNADCLEDAQFVAAKIKEAFPTIGQIKISNLGIVIGSHTGPGLLAIFYYGDKRVA